MTSSEGRGSAAPFAHLVPRPTNQRRLQVMNMSHAMSEKKPALVAERFAIRLCPVCGKRAYSHTGVHPQCSVQQADAPRQAILLEERRLERLNRPK